MWIHRRAAEDAELGAEAEFCVIFKEWNSVGLGAEEFEPQIDADESDNGLGTKGVNVRGHPSACLLSAFNLWTSASIGGLLTSHSRLLVFIRGPNSYWSAAIARAASPTRAGPR